MKTLCVILARAGSKGLPGKNVAELRGRPLIAYTIDHARAARCVDRIVVSTDGEAIAQVAHGMGVDVIMRPPELASDTATVDSAARHAVKTLEERGEKFDAVVILYGNVPLRPADLIDRAVEKLRVTGCDSVQSVCPVGKMHPYWMKTLSGVGKDVLEHYQPNHVYRRQDLPPCYMLDGGIIVVTPGSLMTVKEGEPHAFLGVDRRAVVTGPGEVVDVDDAKDLAVAEALLSPSHRAAKEVRIGGQVVGSEATVYIIAELGVNHDGSLERALELTRAAAEAGASAVKLQLFDARMLLSGEAELAAYQEQTADSPLELLQALQLSVDEMVKVRELAHELEMGFIVTPFSLELVPELKRLKPDAVKIASPDSVNLPLVEAVAGLGKPVIVSLGTTEERDLPVLKRMQEVCAEVPLVLMECVSSYPVPEGGSAIGSIPRIAAEFGVPVGYSDHTTSVYTGMLAVAAGACMVEKHLTYDKEAEGPDHAASFDPTEFAEYVDLIGLAESERLGGDDAELEADVRRVSRQSVCAVRDLRAGEVVRREDVTVKRPGTGIPAARLGEVVGKKLTRDVKANYLLHEGDVA